MHQVLILHQEEFHALYHFIPLKTHSHCCGRHSPHLPFIYEVPIEVNEHLCWEHIWAPEKRWLSWVFKTFGVPQHMAGERVCRTEGAKGRRAQWGHSAHMCSDVRVHQCVQTTGKKEVAARDEGEEKGKSQPWEVCYQLQLLAELILLTEQQANKSRDELLG